MKKQKTIFELELIEYDHWEKPKYPKFKIERTRLGVFSSLAKAEQGIENYIKQQKSYEKLCNDNRTQNIFGFKINEIVCDEISHWLAESRRNYLSDGSFWDESVMSERDEDDGPEPVNPGRPMEKMRWKIGDLVEVLRWDDVRLEIVGNLPRTPEEKQKWVERVRKRVGREPLDNAEDGYYTLDKDGDHSHPYAFNMFPLRLKVSKKLKEKLFSDEYYSYRALYDNIKK